MKFEKLFDGVYKVDGKLATLNLAKGHRVYNETLENYKDEEYRLWNPYRSKLAAAIINGLQHMEIKNGSDMLYLGTSTGTTPSHVSDIIGMEGHLFGVEISKRSMREFIKLCTLRKNMLPILSDATLIENYSEIVPKEGCDVIYQDVSAKYQSDILIKNSIFLKKGGYAYFIIKSQSIDVGKRPSEVFKKEIDNLSPYYDVKEKIDINPFDKLHMFVVIQKK